MRKAILTFAFGFVAIGIVLMSFSGCNHKNEDDSKKKKEYQIKDEGPGGGIVFYFNKEGFKVYDGKGGEQVCHYLEMSKISLGQSKWMPVPSGIGTEEGLGYGKANTYKIRNTIASSEILNKDITEDTCAEYAVRQYSTSTTKPGDWWLPSKEELQLMYETVDDIVVNTTAETEIEEGGEVSKELYAHYWTSTEEDDTYVEYMDFQNGTWHDCKKDKYKNEVRAVRAF